VIFPGHQFCRDGAMSVAKMLDLLAREDRPLSALVASLPEYHLHKEGLEVPVERRQAVLDAVVRLSRGRDVETLDGVKIREPDGWVLVRPSGTEPLFRVYAEAKTPERAKALAAEGLALLRRALEEAGPTARP
jgi:phosphomannomutase/phosphoglucomutase